MTVGTFSRSPGYALPERLAAFGAFPVPFAEERLFVDQLRRCLHEALDVSTAHPLTVSILTLLLPPLLPLKHIRHDRATAVIEHAISSNWHHATAESSQKTSPVELKKSKFLEEHFGRDLTNETGLRGDCQSRAGQSQGRR